MERGSANAQRRPTPSDGASRTPQEIDAEIEAKKNYLNPALIADRADGLKKLDERAASSSIRAA